MVEQQSSNLVHKLNKLETFKSIGLEAGLIVNEGEIEIKRKLILRSFYDKDRLAYDVSIGLQSYVKLIEPIEERYNSLWKKATIPKKNPKLEEEMIKVFTSMNNVGVIMAYRADIFAKYNITLPETWDDLVNICKILKEKEPGMKPFAMRAQRPDFAFSIIYRGFGGKYIDENSKSVMDEGIAENSINYFVNLLKNYAPEGVANYSYTEVQADFMQGKIVMTIEPQDTFVRLEDPKESPLTAGKIGYWTIPKGVTRVAPGFSWVMIMPKNTQKKEEAAQFIGWLMSPEIAGQIDITSTKQEWEKLYAVPAYKDYPQSISLLDCMKRTAEFTDLDYCPRDSKFAELKTTIINSIQACLTGSTSAKDAAKEIVEASKKIYP